MVSLEDATIARVSKAHTEFEVLVDPEKALELKKGKDVNIENILAVKEIFKDSKKGERVSEEDLQRAFGTKDTLKIAETIIKTGEIQLTTEQRRKLNEEKRRQVAEIISKQGADPKTNAPHPINRILNAMEEAHINIDPFKPASDQVESTLSAIQGIIPIKLERVEIEIRIPIKYAGKASSVLRGMAPVKREEWKSDSWVAVIEIPAGIQGDIYNRLNELTSGQAETRIIKTQGI